MQPRSEQTDKAQRAKGIAVFKLGFIMDRAMKPRCAQLFLNPSLSLPKNDVAVIAQQNPTNLLIFRDDAENIDQHGADMGQNRLALMRKKNDGVELFKNSSSSCSSRSEYISVVEIECFFS